MTGKLETKRHLRRALELARLDQWDGEIPAVDGISLKIGIWVQSLRTREPGLWRDDIDDLVDRLSSNHPELLAKIAQFDPRAVGFLMRTQRFIAASRAEGDA